MKVVQLVTSYQEVADSSPHGLTLVCPRGSGLTCEDFTLGVLHFSTRKFKKKRQIIYTMWNNEIIFKIKNMIDKKKSILPHSNL